jgi:hypothetical protein
MTLERRASLFQRGRRILTRFGRNGMAVAVTVGVMLASAPADPLALRRDHAIGWCIIASCVLSIAACAVLLA